MQKVSKIFFFRCLGDNVQSGPIILISLLKLICGPFQLTYQTIQLVLHPLKSRKQWPSVV